MENKELIAVIFTSDEDGHEYLIPVSEEDEFERLLKAGEVDFLGTEEEIEKSYAAQHEFEIKFGDLRVEGNKPKIFVEKGWELNQ